MAAKKKEFSKNQFEKLCEIQCTKQEICDWYGTTDMTLEKWVKRTYDGKGFSEVFEQKRGTGKTSLRRIQWRLANKNVAMAIFLGKQFLGQKDVSRKEITGDDGGPIKTEQPLIDWSKFSIVQLHLITKIMEQVGSDDEAGGRNIEESSGT